MDATYLAGSLLGYASTMAHATEEMKKATANFMTEWGRVKSAIRNRTVTGDLAALERALNDVEKML